MMCVSNTVCTADPRHDNLLSLFSDLPNLFSIRPVYHFEYRLEQRARPSGISEIATKTGLSTDFASGLFNPGLANDPINLKEDPEKLIVYYEPHAASLVESIPFTLPDLGDNPDNILQSYQMLREKHKSFVEAEYFDIEYIPPFAAALLSRLPDKCRDPQLFLRELADMHEELADYRHSLRAIDLNEIRSVSDAKRVKKLIEVDATKFGSEFNAYGRVPMRLKRCLSPLVALMLLISKDPREIFGQLPTIPDKINEFILDPKPTAAYRLASDSVYGENYYKLLNEKLPVIGDV